MSDDSDRIQPLIAERDALRRERDLIEEAHREWLSALDAVDTPIFIHDQEFGVLRANRAYERLAGHPQAEMVGHPYFEFFPRQDGPLPGCRKALKQTGEHREEFEVEGKLFRSRSFAVRDEGGGYRYSVHILDDITKMRQAERALQKSKNQLQAIFDNSPNGVAIFQAVDDGADFEFREFSPAAERIDHIQRDQVIGRRLTEVFPGAEEFGLPAVLRRVWRTGKAEYFEPTAYRDDRIEGWRENHIFKLPQGEVVALYRDVTAQKQAEADLRHSEATYRALFDNSLHGIAHCRMIFDAQGRPIDYLLLQVNPAYYQATGLKDVEGKRVSEVIPGYCENNPESLETFGRVATTRQPERWEHHLKDLGRWYSFGLYSPSPGDVVVVIDDITAKKKAELALTESEARYRTLFEGSRDALMTLAPPDWRFVTANQAALALFGVPDVERWGALGPWDLSPEMQPDGQPSSDKARAMIETAMQRGSHVFAWEHRVLDGPSFPAEVLLTRIELGGQPLLQATVRDISERMRAEAELRDSEARYRTLFGASRDALFILKGQSLDIVDANLTALAMFGATRREEVVGRNTFELSAEIQTGGEPAEERARRVIGAALAGEGAPFEWICRKPDGRQFPVEVMLTPFEIDSASLLLAALRDSSERKRHETEMQAAHDLLRSVVENIPLRVFWKDRDLRYLGCNTLFARDAGLDAPDALVGKNDYAMGWHEQAELYRSDDRKVMDADTPKLNFEEPQTTPDGGEIWLRTSKVPLHDKNGAVRGVLGVYADITRERLDRKALERANLALRTISAGNQALIHAEDEMDLLHLMCQVAVEFGGYRFAWIGYVRGDEPCTIEPMAQKGKAEGYLKALNLACGAAGDGVPEGEAIRTGKTQIVQNLFAHPQGDAWCELAHRFGFVSCIALPLKEEAQTFGVLVLLDDEPNVFGAQEVEILEEMAGDLAFGIQTLRIKKAHAGHEKRLQDSLMETVQTVASIVEMRDPYTAGHQRRVAELAQAVGREMGWDEERCQVLYLAGVVHDVGKIYIPSEILSKPSNLTPVEFDFVRSHAQAGYEILKPVHFPWPIAEIVHQHHERLDGSGYPQGLKGDEILPEARILMVADVVEAIASHRPYRPSLGMEAALDEIENKRGSIYDAEAVDACLRLIRDKGFSFSG